MKNKTSVILVGVISLALIIPLPLMAASAQPTPTTKPSPLDKIIEGAKKEGTVSVELLRTLNPASIPQLQAGIKKKFGVDLVLNLSNMTNHARALVAAKMEFQSGLAHTTFDLYSFGNPYFQEAAPLGIVEIVDWKSILTPDMNPDVVQTLPGYYGSIIYYGSNAGIVYNTEKVSVDEAPYLLSDLAKPKWKGKVSVANTLGQWGNIGFIMGADKVLTDLRAVMANGALVGSYADQTNRLQLGEVWLSQITSSYYKQAKDKGTPVAWLNAEHSFLTVFPLSVPARAKHPNAAKLVALYLASPDGSKYLEENATASLHLNPGNFEYDLYRLGLAKGKAPYLAYASVELLKWEGSNAYAKYRKEVDLILKTAGRGGEKKKKK